MAQFFETACKTYVAGGALGEFLRVKRAAGVLALAGVGATDGLVELGTMERPALAAGDIVPVRLRSAQGTCKMVASAAIAVDAVVYGAASGKIATTVSGDPIGVAQEAATADGDVIEVLRIY